MARPNRSDIVLPALPIHVIIRGNNRRRLFSYPTDYREYFRFLAIAADRHEVLLHAGTLITNHGHLIATPPSVEALSKCMHSASQRYAVRRNFRRGGSGKVYEERFQSWSVRDEHHEASLFPYLDLNAVKAGIVEHPGDYPWSTYHVLCGRPRLSKIDVSMWSVSTFWLGLGDTDTERGCRYEDWVERHMPSPLRLLAGNPYRREILAADAASAPYLRRLERPNRTSAR